MLITADRYSPLLGAQWLSRHGADSARTVLSSEFARGPTTPLFRRRINHACRNRREPTDATSATSVYDYWRSRNLSRASEWKWDVLRIVLQQIIDNAYELTRSGGVEIGYLREKFLFHTSKVHVKIIRSC